MGNRTQDLRVMKQQSNQLSYRGLHVQSVIRLNLYTQNQVGHDFILCIGDCQFFAGFYLIWSNIRLNILTDLSPQVTRTIRAEHFRPLFGPIFGTNTRRDIGSNVWPEDQPKNQPNASARIIRVTFRPKFAPEMARRIRPEYFSTRAKEKMNF